MVSEPAPDQNPGVVYVDEGGSGVGRIIIGVAILALVAIVAFFLLQSSRQDEMRTDAVTSAASSMADAGSRAADTAPAK